MELYPIFIPVIISIFINSYVDYAVFAKPDEETPPLKGVIALSMLSFMGVGLNQIIAGAVYWFILDFAAPAINNVVIALIILLLNIIIYSIALYVCKKHPSPELEGRLVTMLLSKNNNPDVQFTFQNEAEEEEFENLKKVIGRPGVVSMVTLSLTFVIGVPAFVLLLYLLK